MSQEKVNSAIKEFVDSPELFELIKVLHVPGELRDVKDSSSRLLQALREVMTESAQDHAKAEMRTITSRMEVTIRRIERLLILSSSVESSDADTSEDVLRAAIVLMHAWMEDSLRTLAIRKLPYAGRDALKGIKFNIDGKDWVERITVADLLHFQGQTVDDLIKDTVKQEMNRDSFSDTNDVMSLMRKLGLDSIEVKETLPSISELMARRHQIVHQCDLQSDEADTFRLKPVSGEQVRAWFEAVKSLCWTIVMSKIGFDSIVEAVSRRNELLHNLRTRLEANRADLSSS